MDNYDPMTMRDNLWYDEPTVMETGRHNMHNFMDSTMNVGQSRHVRFGWRKMIPLLPYIAFFLVALMIWRVGAGPQWFPVRSVKVEGAFQQVTRSEIKETVMPFVMDGFFHCDSYGLKEKLLSNPWIADSYVKRNWPDGVSLVIKEHQPLARWQNSGLISDKQKRFVPHDFDAKRWYHLPHLSGPEDLWLDIATLYQKLEARAATASLHVHALQASDRQSWQVKLNNGTQVKLGRESPELKFSLFLQTYLKMPERERSRMTSVDMRYPNGMAVS